jgi:hypothetical protein
MITEAAGRDGSAAPLFARAVSAGAASPAVDPSAPAAGAAALRRRARVAFAGAVGWSSAAGRADSPDSSVFFGTAAFRRRVDAFFAAG